MNILKRLQEGVRLRFFKKIKTKNSHQKPLVTTENSNSSELYNTNEDIGFC